MSSPGSYHGQKLSYKILLNLMLLVHENVFVLFCHERMFLLVVRAGLATAKDQCPAAAGTGAAAAAAVLLA
jgi:hypothetical protein